MVLVVLMMLFRAQSDQAIARAQFLKSQSLVLADAAGVTYQSFLLRYPELASYSSDKWSNFANSVTTDCALAGLLKPNDIQLIQQISSQGSNWQAINPKDLSQGQLRLVNYQYVPDPGVDSHQAPGLGILQVEGRARAKGSIGEAFGFGSSRSRVELQFRVDPKAPSELSAGLVASQFSASANAFGKPVISSNVCDLGAGKTSAALESYLVKLANGDNSKLAYSTNFTAPPPTDGDAPMSGLGVYDLGNFTLGANHVCQLPMSGSHTTTDGLPQNCPTALSEIATTDALGRAIYRYNLTGLSLGVSSSLAQKINLSQVIASSDLTSGTSAGEGNARLILGRTGKEVIHLYIEGNTILKQSRISVFPGTKVFLYLHGSLMASDVVPEGFLENTQNAENLQVYLYQPPAGMAQNVSLNAGHGTAKAFIFAPNADVSLLDVKIDGAIWAKSISIVGDSGITQNLNNPMSLRIMIPGRKRIGPALTWQQREATG